MEFRSFGNKANRKIMFIHGVLTPWQIWNPQIAYFSKTYHVIVPALDGHTSEKESEFLTIQEEAEKIENYCAETIGLDFFAVCGISMGGAIAHLLWKSRAIKIEHLILDGAPLIPYGFFMQAMMTRQYVSIVRNSQKRNEKTLSNFKKYFLPEKYLNDYLSIIDNLSIPSIKNMVLSMSTSALIDNDINQETKVMYIHGTEMNELFSKKSAQLLKKCYPSVTIVQCDGCSHVYYAIYDPQRWISTVEEFLNR